MIDDLTTATTTAKRGLKSGKWTLESIATSTSPQLSKVRGISLKSAGLIIEEARTLLHTKKLTEAIEPEPITIPASAVRPEIGMSPRVRRAIMSSDQEWNK
jgi:hypothetical protein